MRATMKHACLDQLHIKILAFEKTFSIAISLERVGAETDQEKKLMYQVSLKSHSYKK